MFTEKVVQRLKKLLNQQCDNATEPRIEPKTFPLLKECSTIWAIAARLPQRQIPALYVLAFHPILHIADLKEEGRKFLKPRSVMGRSQVRFLARLYFRIISLKNYSALSPVSLWKKYGWRIMMFSINSEVYSMVWRITFFYLSSLLYAEWDERPTCKMRECTYQLIVLR